jgi:phosphonate transport system permease protein
MSAPPVTPSVATSPDARRRRAPRPWLPVVAQAVLPGSGYVVTGRLTIGLVTLALVPVTVITTHMRIVEGQGSEMLRTAIWAGLLGLFWLNLVAHVFVLSTEDAADVALLRRLDGHRPGPAMWLASRNWLLVVGTLFLIDRMALDAEVDFREFFKSENVNSLRRISIGLIHPDFSILQLVVTEYAWVTLEMAVIGTILGSLVSAPISFLGARNLLGRNPVTAPIYYVTRFILSVVRSIPTLIWGLMAISFGLGHFPGVIALSIFSFGLTAKLYSEAIEAIDWGPVEAVTAAGANPLHTLIFGVVPQVVPYFIAHFLYCLEVNVHSSVVLGLIGAGGLGLIVNEYIATFHWEEASTVLIVTIVMTLSIDYGSAYIRGRVV